MKPLPAGTDSESILSDWQGVGDLLDQAVFVADSCVYLHLYRLLGTSRTELAAALRSVASRLWVPHQVMKEVLDNFRTMPATILREGQQSANYVAARTSEIEVDMRRTINRVKPHDPIGRMRLKAVIDASRAAQEWLVASGRTDEDPAEALAKENKDVSEIITALTAGRVGPEPTVEQHDRWIMDSRKRLVNHMPPSHGERRRKEALRHGDCIIWHEMIEFAMSDHEVRVLVLVTRDGKANGWVGYEGQRLIGAHHDLVHEMMAAAKTQFIVMGTSDLLAYTKDAAIRVVWERDPCWGDTEETGSLRPVSSFFV